MGGKVFFRIEPYDQQAVTRLVESVPDNWAWMDGRLQAPERQPAPELGASGKAIGLQIDPDRLEVAHDSGRGDEWEGLLDILEGRAGFSFVNFRGAGAGIMKFSVAKRIALILLRQGFRGDMLFYRGSYYCRSADTIEFPVLCSIHCQPWTGSPLSDDEPGRQPARVRVEWQEEFGGRPEDVAPILEACRELGLKEYIPFAPAIRRA